MLKTIKRISAFIVLTALLLMLILPATAFAADEPEAEVAIAQAADTDVKSSKAISAAIVVGLGAAVGAISMGLAIAKSSEAIARQPEASSSIRSGLMLGLVFIETAIIYALIVAILIIFVL